MPTGWTSGESPRQKAIPRAAWAKARQAVFYRDGHVCALCGATGANHVDHVVPMHRGGSALDRANLRVLCVNCHHHVTAVDAGKASAASKKPRVSRKRAAEDHPGRIK